jgi:hypothetical protein
LTLSKNYEDVFIDNVIFDNNLINQFVEEVIKAIFKFFSLENLHFGYKLSVGILIVLAVLFVNDFLGLSRHFILNSKLEQIIQLKQVEPNILKDDTAVLNKYKKLKSAIINDQSKWEAFYSSVRNIAVRPRVLQSQQPNTPNNSGKSSKSTIDWVSIGAMGFFYMAIGFMVFAMFFSLFNKEITSKEKVIQIASMAVISPMIYYLGWLYKLLILQIPIIGGYIWINSAIAFIMPVIITTLIIIRTNKK